MGPLSVAELTARSSDGQDKFEKLRFQTVPRHPVATHLLVGKMKCAW